MNQILLHLILQNNDYFKKNQIKPFVYHAKVEKKTEGNTFKKN